MTKRCWSLFSKHPSCSQHGGQMCWHVSGDGFFFNSHPIRCASDVCSSTDASSADSQHQHLTVFPKSANNSSNIHLQSLRGGQMLLFSFLSEYWWRGLEAAGCRRGERGFDDWQTLRSHASLVVIKNKHTEQGRKHTFHQSWVRFREPRRNASSDRLPSQHQQASTPVNSRRDDFILNWIKRSKATDSAEYLQIITDAA